MGNDQECDAQKILKMHECPICSMVCYCDLSLDCDHCDDEGSGFDENGDLIDNED